MAGRRAMVRAAAVAAVAAAGWVRAEGTTDGRQPVAPFYLQEQPPQVSPDETRGAAEEPTPPRLLMSVLGKTGIGQTLNESRINVFGHVEGSWTHNFSSSDRLIVGRSFDLESDDPTFNQLDLTIERAITPDADQWDLGGRVEWIWGADARFIHSVGLYDHQGFDDGPDNQFDLTQAYVDINVPVGKGLRLRAGKFLALAGYEVINPTGNQFYSHSYLFAYSAPYTHTGVLGTYQLSDKVTVNAGVSRGWDTSLEDNNGTVDFIGGVTYTITDKTNINVNVIAGPDQPGDNGNWRNLFDLVVSHKLSEDLTATVNADYGYEANSTSSVSGSDAQWFGLAGYLSKTISKSCTLNGRAEYFNDQDGARIGGTSTSWYEATVGVALRPFPDHPVGKNLVVRPEVRFDYAEDPVFNGDYNVFTFGIDAYFTF